MIRLGPLTPIASPAEVSESAEPLLDVNVLDADMPASGLRGRGPSKEAIRRSQKRLGRWLFAILLTMIAILVWVEFKTSFVQAHGLSYAARHMRFWTVSGAAPKKPLLSESNAGPYDERMGYSFLPQMGERLERAGYLQTTHTELSGFNRHAVDLGLPPIYREKLRGGLLLEDVQGAPLYQLTIPREAYPAYAAIAPVMVQTLLFAENRQILEESLPYRNPTIEWERLLRAVLDFGLNKVNPGHPVTGASTVATQLEKLRHSPGGRTLSSGDKLRQMMASSLRVYQQGPENLDARRQIVSDYINSLPLAATPAKGEIIGLADGLRAWFGVDPYQVNQLLLLTDEEARAASKFDARARAYREAVSLLLAAKRPSAFLIDNREALVRRVDTYLILLAKEGIISMELRDAALAIRPLFRDHVVSNVVSNVVTKKPQDAVPDVLHETVHTIPPPPEQEGEPKEVPAPPAPLGGSALTTAERKGIDAIRVALLGLTGAESLYALDRLDLTASTTLDRNATTAVAHTLQSLSQPEAAGRAGLFGKRLLSSDDAGGMIYSFTLYQRQELSGQKLSGKIANVLRVQADNYPQPLNINQGTKLELGSTAKLRTLAAYLEIVTELHQRLSGMTTEQLENLQYEREDTLTAWAEDYLVAAQDRSLNAMLEASVARKFSASAGEGFFTGGGLHTFANFDGADGGRLMPISEALHRSVNLVFIRVMREILNYRMAQHPDTLAVLHADAQDPKRRQYLARFADYEGRTFLEGFYRKYSSRLSNKTTGADKPPAADKPPEENALDTAFTSSNKGVSNKLAPGRFAVIYRTLRPTDGLEAFAAAAAAHGVEFKMKGKVDPLDRVRYEAAQLDGAQRLFAEFAPGSKGTPGEYNWNDLGYIAKVHPLELWIAKYLAGHPAASFNDVMRDSAEARQEAYSWLFRPGLRREQNNRIHTLLEKEAFVDIHKSWAKLGFPFPELVPSLATAIGSSGDTPDALATLAGIILNGGVRYPSVRIPKLQFAAGTPYETTFERDLAEGERVMPPQVAAIMHREMIGVVEHGTAFGAGGIFKNEDGTVIAVGGKTGTGDNRVEHYASNGSVIESKVRNRTATFVFTIGERFFGTLVVYAEGPSAQNKTFTIALAVQVFRILAPQLRPLVLRP